MTIRGRYITDRGSRVLLLVSASLSFIVLLGIAVFTFRESLPALTQIGLLDFLFGTEWRPLSGKFGILPMIVGSLAVTGGALLLAIPWASAVPSCWPRWLLTASASFSGRRWSCWWAYLPWSTVWWAWSSSCP
jgi:ABC-type phosphate transport system permease subunit